MNKIVIFLPVLFLSFSSIAKKKSKFNFDVVTVESGISFDIVEAEDIKARVFGYNLGISIQDSVTRDLSLFFGGTVSLETGSNEVVGTVAEFEPNEHISLAEGGLQYNPINFLQLRVGALNQGKLESPLLIGSNAFAAIEEKIDLGVFYFIAQQAIPSNNKLSKRLGTVETGTPYFSTETLGLKLGSKNSIKLEASHFSYKDLSSGVAENSEILGNSVTGLGGGKAFNYGFDGYNITMSSRYSFGKSSVSFGGQYLFNDKAPSGRNSGQLLVLGVSRNLYGFYFESFRNESDTAPSFYNSKYYGHNNMQGSGGIFRVKSKSFNLNLRYAEMKPIEENSIQSTTQILSFNLVKSYDL